MYTQVIVGYDGSPQADDALVLGKLIAGATGASLTAVAVLQFDPFHAELAEKLERAAGAAGASAETTASSSPARGLRDFAERTGADLVVLGSARHGKAGQILAGSVAMSLVRRSPCPVAIAPRGYAAQVSAGIAEVAIGYDGLPESRTALAEAIDLARATTAPLKLVTVAEAPLEETIQESMRKRLADAQRSIPDDIQVEPALVDGDPARELARIAVADGGVLVVGSRANGPVRRILLGSVSTKLVRSAPCPVIVHPRPAKAPAANAAGSTA